ncbi:MAG: hypothetical protein R3F56_15765 [Planctomycetota bacterium]
MSWLWAAVLAASSPGMAQGASAPPWPSGLVVFVRVGDGGGLDGEDLRALAGLGVRGVLLPAGADPAAARARGLVWAVDGASGNGILPADGAEVAALRAAYARSRDTADLVPTHCLCAADTSGELLRRVTASIRAGTGDPPCAVVLADGPSTTHGSTPLDLSFSPAALAEFRAWLRARYGSAEALARAWQVDARSFDAVAPFTVDRLQARASLLGDLVASSLAPWSDHRAFMDDVLAGQVGALAGVVRAATSRAGLLGLPLPSAYGGGDYARLLRGVDVFEVADIGGARDLAMAMALPAARQLRRLQPAGADTPAPWVRAQLADALAHGMAGVLVPDAGVLLDREGAAVRPSTLGLALRDALARLRPLAPFAGARLQRSDVWIVESQASVQALWLLDRSAEGVVASAVGGGSVEVEGSAEIGRSAATEQASSTSLATRASWLRLLQDLGLQAQLVPVDGLAADLETRTPRLLVLAGCIALGDAAADAIAAYVERGGTVVADGMLGVYDDRMMRRDRPALDDLFGLAPRTAGRRSDLLVRRARPVAAGRLPTGAAACERRVDAALCERHGDLAVQCERRHGRGLACYLNLAVCEYDRVRLDPSRVASALDLRRRVRRVLDAADVQPPVLARGRGLPTCLERTMLVAEGGRRLLCVRVNAVEHPDLLRTLAARAEPTLTLQFARPVRLRLLDEAQPRGPSAAFEVPFDPWLGVFAEVLP